MIISRPSFLRPLVLSVLAVSVLFSKGLHLFQHATSIPPTSFVAYFPTFFLQEALLIVGAWALLHKTTGVPSILGTAVTVLITYLTFILSASQTAFYLVTGSEVRWDAAASVGNDREGRKLIFSGLGSFLGAAVVLAIVSWLVTPGLSVWINNWVSALFSLAATNNSDEELPITTVEQPPRKRGLIQFWTVCAMLGTLGLYLLRPQVPYTHMSGSLPFTFFQALRPKPAIAHQPGDHAFPLQDGLGEENWEGSNGHFKGWAPGMGLVYADKTTRPSWAFGNLPPGFHRWTDPSPNSGGDAQPGEHEEPKNGTSKHFYNPVDDPLRITNLDHKVLEPLTRALKDHLVPINHVVLVMMESARKEIFPFKYGSHLHQDILSSYRNQEIKALQEVNDRLSCLTPIAEKLTGESGGFSQSENHSTNKTWQDTAEPGMGGINVNGVLTGSSLSFKSVVMNHCGVGPLPVNFLREVETEIYQPCFMQILGLFNRLKENSTDAGASGSGKDNEPIHNRKWNSVFLQAATGMYDHQNILNEMMGFKKAIYREDIGQNEAKYHHDDMKEINYFGYAEREVYPYLRDVVNNTVRNNERLFLSHFTSTTHHPWKTPSDFPDEQYFADDGVRTKHEDMNRYLNTVRYVDSWLGDMLGVLDEVGIANETLVVFVGDHGQAFHEDAPVSGTYENGHISNFRVPLVFRHPLLPRIQVNANATSMSVLPTILDLLATTKSLNQADTDVVIDLLNEYEGQSLIRPYQATHQGRQAWNFGIINAGGTMLSVGSAAVPYRLILPLTSDFEFVFSNLDTDPHEVSPLRGWSVVEVIHRVRREHGDKAADWVADAEKVGRWWVEERKRLWNYQ